MADMGYAVISSQEYKELILKTKQLEETENLYKEKDEELFKAKEKMANQKEELDKLLKVLVNDRKIYDGTLETFNIARDNEIVDYLNEHYLKEIKEFCEEE